MSGLEIKNSERVKDIKLLAKTLQGGSLKSLVIL